MTVAEDKMVEDRAVDRFGSGGEAARCTKIAVAGAGIAARMVMGEDDPGTAESRGVGDYSSERKGRAHLVAIMPGNVNAAGLVIDMGNPQILHRRVRIGNAPGKIRSGRGEAVELERGFGTLIAHASLAMAAARYLPHEPGRKRLSKMDQSSPLGRRPRPV